MIQDGTQNCLVFQLMTKYLEVGASTNQFVQWKPRYLSDEGINISPNSFNLFNLYWIIREQKQH